jgi:small subunit ribosomal protein S8
MINDLVADMLTRIRNATMAKHSFTRVAYSKLNLAILKVLLSEGYIKSYEVQENNINTKKEIKIFLKYKGWWIKKPFFSNLKRISRPGQRVFSGYKKFRNCSTLDTESEEIYDELAPNDNFGNFDRVLRRKYENSFIEIVSETTFCSRSYNLTEKTTHAFYGCNFPIILSGCGAIQHLRDVGFDMFDDIIDHRYGDLENPIDRVSRAIDDNEHLLCNGDRVKTLWQENRHRFIKNVEVAKNIERFYQDRARKIWQNIVWK